ncbi:MAG TPA: tRNA pseudouridine(38-40) synthase TruA [Ktedonobacteraceae bacterium]|jgi:tRNA pseudouridine38-40 synthase|nr:tRNA pseudouridine(38-40) synthase TruA [Ktedonobacteraceae bacterium]
MKLACGIEYDGTDYHGFQRQAEERGPTIQGTLEEAIKRISGREVVVYGAGRTDAGVHASGQVIHFSADSPLSPQVWMRALNAVLPRSVAIRWISEVPDSFHARFSALSRSYRYTIWNEQAPSPLHARYTTHVWRELAVDLMNDACRLLLGRKDFGAFGRSPDEHNPRRPGPHSCVRTLLHASCQRQDALIYCNFTADAFLTGMVRRMVGTLLLVGQKRLSLGEFAAIVQRAEITHPGSAAPPHGLCLVGVTYPEGILRSKEVTHDEDI